MKDSFAFIATRQAEHGPVFRTHLLGRPTAVVIGPDATRAFIDPELIERAGSMPTNVQALFAGLSLPLLDGQDHKARKQQVLAAFTPTALAGYMPAMQKRAEETFARWAKEDETRGIAALKQLALETIGINFFGFEPGPTTEQMSTNFDVFSAGFAALPVPLPGTQYKRTLDARERILAVLRATVEEHRNDPKKETGLAHILRAKADDGSAISDEAVVLEIHHVQIAGYIVFAWMSAALVALSTRKELCAALTAEAKQGDGKLDPKALAAMPKLAAFVREVKRHTPVLSVSFGKAKKTFELSGVRIPEGWMVMHGLRQTNIWESSFADPSSFDPERYARGEGNDENIVYVPQGAGPRLGHKCAGTDYATILLSVFVATLLRGTSFELPEQDLAYDFRRIPPEPISGLRVRFRAQNH